MEPSCELSHGAPNGVLAAADAGWANSARFFAAPQFSWNFEKLVPFRNWIWLPFAMQSPVGSTLCFRVHLNCSVCAGDVAKNSHSASGGRKPISLTDHQLDCATKAIFPKKSKIAQFEENLFAKARRKRCQFKMPPAGFRLLRINWEREIAVLDQD